MITRLILVFSFLIFLPSNVVATVYYAADDGSGTTCSDVSPCDLVYALETKSSSGDTVVAQEGDYSVTQIEIPDGIDLISENLDASEVTISPSTSYGTSAPFILFETAADSTNSAGNEISYITIDGQGVGTARIGIGIWGRDQVRVHHCVIENFNGLINSSAIEIRGEGTPSSDWWDFWPADPGVDGDDSTIEALWQASGYNDSVKDIEIDNNEINDCGYTLYNGYKTGAVTLWNVKDSNLHHNVCDNSGYPGQFFTGRGNKTGLLNNVDIYYNQMDVGNLDAASGTGSRFGIEIWVMYNGCEFYGNTGIGTHGGGGYSITVGKNTKIYDNEIWYSPQTDDCGYGIEGLIQTLFEVYGNTVKNHLFGMNVGIQNSSGEDYVVKNFLIHNNLFISCAYWGIEATCRGPRFTATDLTVEDIFVYNNTCDQQNYMDSVTIGGVGCVRLRESDTSSYGETIGTCTVNDYTVVNNLGVNSTTQDSHGYFGMISGTFGGSNTISNNHAYDNDNNQWSGTTESGIETSDPNLNGAWIPEEPTTCDDGGVGGSYPDYVGWYDINEAPEVPNTGANSLSGSITGTWY